MSLLEPQTDLPRIVDRGGETFLAVGADVVEEGVFYRVWAPDHASVRVAIGGGPEPVRDVLLERETGGFFSVLDRDGRIGDWYRFRLGNELVPDPASRYQPLGIEQPSQVIEPRTFHWQTTNWRRPPLRGRVIYELHVGAFTAEGTFRAAIERFDELVDLGVNTIELMPVAEFAGDRNWGYDGVLWFAPARCYGTPDELRLLVDEAHARGLAVVLDVVYNHLGPCGNVLRRFSRDYFHPSRATSWGESLNFDGEHSTALRQLVVQNACYWLDEFHIDGLRLDAVHAIEDASLTHIVAEIAVAARARGAFTIGEDERNEVNVILPANEGGWGVDGVWSDDFHHTVRVALTGQRESYFGNYTGSLDEWTTTLRDGWLFHGQYFSTWRRARGTMAAHRPPESFVVCISNHDQVGNRPRGDRLHSEVSLAEYRAVSLLLCLVPYTPMLFMGQEWAAGTPFPYFTDHPGEVGVNINANRRKEFAERWAVHSEAELAHVPDPQAESTFLAAKLNWDERDRAPHREMLNLYRAALKVRAENPCFQSAPRSQWSVRKPGNDLLALRWHGSVDDPREWLLLVSIATTDEQRIVTGPIAQPRAGHHWQLVLATEEERFGGHGAREATGGENGAPVLATPGAMLLRET
jgi:maltooligosyltrehalose trehalohydrolase